jgi:hypothetical protein
LTDGSRGAHSIPWGDVPRDEPGGRREAIFEDTEDRQRLLETPSEASQNTGWQVDGYCLMRSEWGIPKET